MSIYRTGSASMDANGVITGTDTAWQSALALIRVGATIIFIRDTIHLATISAIVSNTEMRALDTDGVVIADGDYVILLHDSITVDGLAQDIAETLRYYQGEETALADLKSTIEGFINQASASATASANSATASANSATASANSATASAGSASDSAARASDSANSATASDNSAKASASSATASANSATASDTSAKASASSATASANSATASANSATAAKTSETNAASTLSAAAKTANNLSDLADKSAAWTNLLTARTVATALTDLKLSQSNSVSFSGLELYGTTPYVDFHFNNTTDDYNVRLINDKNGVLSFFGANGMAMLSSRIYFGTSNQMAIRGATSGTTNYVIAEGGPFYASIGYRTQAGTTGAAGSNAFNFYWTGSQLQAYIDSTSAGFVTLTTTSDRQLKKDIAYRDEADDSDEISKALNEVMQWRPADFKMKERGIIPEGASQLGFIANDLKAVSPECVSGGGLPDDYDIESDPNNGDAYYLNHIPMIAKLTMALQKVKKTADEQAELIENQNKIIQALAVRLKDIDGLDG